MPPISRRDLLRSTAVGGLASSLGANVLAGGGSVSDWEIGPMEVGPAKTENSSWIHSCRTLIAEAYNPPFYPSFDYRAERAVAIAKRLNADSFRYPAASYFAYFPTRTQYPIHPELKGAGTDPMRETIDLCHRQGLKVVAYMPLNHPFMEVRAKDPRYEAWVKRFENGEPMTTEHYGFTLYYEGCLNSPVRDQISRMVKEVITGYDIDAAYFDGPYMGMRNARRFCYCDACQAAYQKARGRRVPPGDGAADREAEIEYTRWLTEEVVIAYLAEIREMIRKERPSVPVLYNDTSLLSRREWRNRAIPVVDGFMFEAAETPEQKLFNLQLGHSTGKTIWTYIGTHTQYNREHMKNERVRGWFTYPVESEELLLDGATALAGHAGMKYWGLSRFFYAGQDTLSYPAGRHVRSVFDFAEKHAPLLFAAQSEPVAGILVGSQTIDWFDGKLFVPDFYKNSYHGAFQLLKELSCDCEPFLDYRLTTEQLSRYRLLYLPYAACLSSAQCAVIRDYVAAGGVLLATHLTSVADEWGRPREDFGLADVFGAHLKDRDPVEIPDLYVKPADGREPFPHDPQAVLVEAVDPGSVVATILDRGHRRSLGPAVIQRVFGKGQSIYIAGSLEAVYDETRMAVLRDFVASLVDPMVGRWRTYQVAPRPGLLAHRTVSGKSILLHLLANTGNKWKKLRQREEYLPIENVAVRIRVAAGARIDAVRLLKADRAAEYRRKDDWLDLTVPRVQVHEIIEVRLS